MEETEIMQGTEEKNHRTNKNLTIVNEKLLHPFKRYRMLWKINKIAQIKKKKQTSTEGLKDKAEGRDGQSQRKSSQSEDQSKCPTHD